MELWQYKAGMVDWTNMHSFILVKHCKSME